MRSLIQSVIVLIAVLRPATGADEVIYTPVGQTVTLKPSQVNYIYWYFGDVEIAWWNSLGGSSIDPKWKDSLSLEGNSLIIRNIKQEHFGTFSWRRQASDPSSGSRFIIYQLSVTNPPSLLLPREVLTLTCNTDGPHKRDIHWLNPQGEKISSSQVRVTVKPEQHDGQWTCIVTHDKKESKAEVSVTIMDLSPLPLRPPYTSKSMPLTIPCSIRSGISWKQIKEKDIEKVHWDFFPSPGSSLNAGDPQRLFSLSPEDPLTWKPEQNRGLAPADLKKGDLSLSRKQGREDDSGDYVCTLKFSNGVTLNRTVHVNVLQIISTPETDLISGQQLNLTCSLGRPLPSDLWVQWVPPPSSLRTPDRHPAHLIIPEVGTGDSGRWRCELWQNGTCLASAVTILKIEPRLSVWMLVIICSVTVIVILILILVFICCRRRQQKMRHLRHRLCRCKNPKPKGFYRT